MSRALILLLVSLGWAGSLASIGTAGDWRQFRGPQGAGVAAENNLPIAWQERTAIAWNVPLPGRGLSSPIIVGDRVYVTCSTGAQQERLLVLCFSAADGSVQWKRQFWATGRTICHEKISVAAPTPTSDGERIFALFSSNDLVCLDLDGNLIWFRGLMLDYPNASNSLGMSSSPVVAGGVLILQVETDTDAFVAGVDARTGTNLWKIERRKRANWTSPLVLRTEDGKELVTAQSSGGVTALDPLTGQAVWNYSQGSSTIPSSALSGNTLYVPSFGITALRVGSDSRPPEQLWRSAQLNPGTASPLALRDKILTLNDAGVLTCADAATGTRRWQIRLKGPFSASPVSAGDQIYLVNEKGLVQVVDSSQPEGQITAELDLGETLIGPPSIANGAIYFRSDSRLFKLGRPSTEHPTGPP